MPYFSKRLAIVLGLCAAVAMANGAAPAVVPGEGIVTHDTGIHCEFGACYSKYFEPTTEFKRILPGQMIPPGLHVKMDFETGEKYAKLMDKSEANQDSENAAVLVVDTESPGSVKHQIGSDDESAVNNNDDDDASQIEVDSQRKLQEVLDCIPELEPIKDQQKQEQPSQPPYSANEPQLFAERLEIIKSSNDNEVVLAALDLLTEQVRFMDYGVRLLKGEGLASLLKRLECDSQDQSECEKTSLIRTTSALVISTALQNNREAQITAFKAGLHKTLLAKSEVEPDSKLLYRILGAFGSLIRCSTKDHNYIGDEVITRFAQLYKNTNDEQVKNRIIFIMSDFADPEMQEDIVDSSNEEDNDMGNSTNPTTQTQVVVKKINVGPWCEVLQQEDQAKYQKYIEDALEFLHGSYPETCILVQKKVKDEL
ncbi:nucleotide exchange factor sil1 [Entomortierella beljakovae]|nr:nucleotide exchange factor sil1 [Entomortierella beljakovae]